MRSWCLIEARSPGVSRRPKTDHHGWQIVSHNAAHCYNYAASNVHTRGDKNSCGKPGLGVDSHWTRKNIETWARVIVRAGAEITLLGDYGVLTDINFAECVQGYVVTDP